MRRRFQRREGAAMLIVLMVLMGTTATATFAIHATTVEMRSAGHSRLAMQTGYLAESGAYGTIAFIDGTTTPSGALIMAQRTTVRAGQRISANATRLGRDTDVFRVNMSDFATAANVDAPPVEVDPVRVPSLGPRNDMVPNFETSGSDVHEVTPPRAGAELSGNSNLVYFYMNITTRARIAPRLDYQRAGDPRTYHESSSNARVFSIAGPVPR